MMKNYQDTLNIPVTNFEMQANLINKEQKILNYWEEIKLHTVVNEGKKKSFIIFDGPPYANGLIHLGHSLNKILKDIINKYKILNGYKIFYTLGWDCHGLPIESKIKTNLEKKNYSKNSFIKNCKKYVQTQIQNQKKDFHSLGILTNWEKIYTTMDTQFKYVTLNTFYNLLLKKQLKTIQQPVLWCTTCKSTVADVEVCYKNITANSVYILFKIKEKKLIEKLFNINIQKNNINFVAFLVWTTTPWTLVANECVAINPQKNYHLIEGDKKLLIVSEKTYKNIENISNEKFKLIGTTIGNNLKNIKIKNPLKGKIVKILTDLEIEDSIGTGCVHIAPAHGPADFLLAKKNNLKINNYIDKNGYYKNIKKETLKILNNINIKNSDDLIKKLLINDNTLFLWTIIEHNYPFCWRHNEQLIYKTYLQWYVCLETNGLRKILLNNIEKKIKWIPSWGKEHMYNMVKTRPDWCISRQRQWGIEFPIFYKKNSNIYYPNTSEKIIKSKNALKKNWKFYIKNTKTLKNYIIDKKIKNLYNNSNTVLDVWFDSGIVPIFLQKIYKKKANLLIEGVDQYRGWFQTTLILSSIINKNPPAKEIISHGFVVDKNGQKMSKSLGNIITPNEIISKHGADILRLWVSSADYTKDVQISEEILKRIIDVYRKIRNSFRFILSNLFDFKNSKKFCNKKLLYIDIILLKKIKKLHKKINTYYKNYKIHQVHKEIYNFCNIDLSNFYFDITKDRLYTCNKNSAQRKSAQYTLYYVGLFLLKWIAPILSFTAEEIFTTQKSIFNTNKKSVFLLNWDNCYHNNITKHVNKKKKNLWDILKIIKTEINKKTDELTIKGEIKKSTDLSVELYITKSLYESLKELINELYIALLVSKVKLKKKKKKKLFYTTKLKNISLIVTKIKNKKCQRCWYKNIKFKKNDICIECKHEIKGKNRKRKYF